MSAAPLLEVRNLTCRFDLPHKLLERRRQVTAVDDVSFDIREGEAFGLVGESGSGKSTIGRIVARLTTPNAGAIRFGGTNWLALNGEALRRRRREVQVVFQSPYASLDPRWRVLDLLAEPLRANAGLRGAALRARAVELMEQVDLDPAWLTRFAHQFSGGQRQRIAIARAIALEPRLLIADEPVSALDVSSQAQILSLLRTIRARTGLALLFISHDLSVIDHLCDTVGVLENGRLVESGPTSHIFRAPQSAYTRTLIDAVPGQGRHGAASPPAGR